MKIAIYIASLLFAALLAVYGVAMIYDSFNDYQAYLRALPGIEFSFPEMLKKEGLKLITGIIFTVSVMLFYMNKKIGWILTSSFVVLVSVFAFFVAYFIAMAKSAEAYLVIAGIILFLVAGIFSFFTKSTRERFGIEKKHIALSLVIGILFAIAFRLIDKLF